MIGLFLVILVILILGIMWSSDGATSENYGSVLGQLAPYQKQLNMCLNQCNRSDPNKRLLAQANINCGRYCEYIMTEMAQNGIPPETLPITDNLKICQAQCNIPLESGRKPTESEKRKCVSMCYGQRQVSQWCKELWCPYSLDDEDSCMNHCFATQNVNNNQVAWKWDMSR